MTSKEKLLAANLLEQASAKFANHGCNDFDLASAGFTDEEARELVEEYHAWNGDPEEVQRYREGVRWQVVLADFALMAFMAAKVGEWDR